MRCPYCGLAMMESSHQGLIDSCLDGIKLRSKLLNKAEEIITGLRDQGVDVSEYIELRDELGYLYSTDKIRLRRKRP